MGLGERDVGSAARPAAGGAGALGIIEDPAAVRRLSRLTGGLAVASTSAFAGLFFVFDEPMAGWLTITLAAAYAVFLLAFTRGALADRLAVMVAVITGVGALNHVGVHVALGGFANSGAYLVWGVSVTLTASLVLPRAAVAVIALGYCCATVGLGFAEESLGAGRPPPDPTLTSVLFVAVIVGAFLMLVPLFAYFLERLVAERTRAEALLANILPADVAAELKQAGSAATRAYPSATVLFADLVGFTAHSRHAEPADVASELNAIFTRFDALAAQHGAERIKTIGDGYMAVTGLPAADPGHVPAACELALDMLAAMPGLNDTLGTDFALRIGVNTGPVVAGVVGTTKFSYDVWGDTVNLASRLESSGIPGAVCVSESVATAAGPDYDLQPLGPRTLKGAGEVEIFRLTGRAAR